MPKDWSCTHGARIYQTSQFNMNGSTKMYCRLHARLLLFFCFLETGNAGTPAFQDFTPGTITEGLPPGTFYYKFVATDATPGHFVIYSLDSKANEWFDINSSSGVATVKKTIDREVMGAPFRYKVFASDGTNTGEADVFQQIKDINDNPPVITNLPKTINITEDSPVGSTVFTVSVTDADASQPARAVEIGFETGNEEGNFEFPNPADGKITLKKSLDYDKGAKQFVLTILAKNTLKSPYLNSTAVLTVNVLDVDDLGAMFVKGLYEATIVKDSIPGTVVTTVQAKDGDSFNATVEYEIYAGTNPGNVYKIDNNTGEIKVNGPLTIGTQLVVVTATSTNHPPTFTVVKITVASMLNASYTITVDEGQSNVVIFDLQSAEKFNKVTGGTFTIIPSARSALFDIDGKNLKVGKTTLDRETQDQYQLQIALDKDGTRKGVVVVTVKVLDINDNTPKFVGSLPYSANITSNKKPCSFFKVSAVDRDTGLNGKVRYSITSGNNEGLFFIDDLTGDVSLNLLAEQDFKVQYLLTIKASDGGIPQMANFTTLIVNFKDLNRHTINGAAQTSSGMITGFVILGIILVLNTCLLGYIIWKGQKKTNSERTKYNSERSGTSAFSNIALEERDSHITDEQNVVPAPTEQSNAPGPASVAQQPSMDTDYERPDRQALNTNQSPHAPHTYQTLNLSLPSDHSTLNHAYEPLHYGDNRSSTSII